MYTEIRKQQKDLECTRVPVEIPESKEELLKPTPGQKMLSLIYLPDSSGLPRGAMQVYLSEKASPEMRRFIEQNILVDIPSDNNSKFDDLDDDFKLAFERGDLESREAYIERINKLMRDYDEREAKPSE